MVLPAEVSKMNQSAFETDGHLLSTSIVMGAEIKDIVSALENPNWEGDAQNCKTVTSVIEAEIRNKGFGCS